MVNWKRRKTKQSIWFKGTEGKGWDIPKDNKEISIFKRVAGINKGKYQVQLWEANSPRKNKVTKASPLVKTKKQAMVYVRKYKKGRK